MERAGQCEITIQRTFVSALSSPTHLFQKTIGCEGSQVYSPQDNKFISWEMWKSNSSLVSPEDSSDVCHLYISRVFKDRTDQPADNHEFNTSCASPVNYYPIQNTIAEISVPPPIDYWQQFRENGQPLVGILMIFIAVWSIKRSTKRSLSR